MLTREILGNIKGKPYKFFSIFCGKDGENLFLQGTQHEFFGRFCDFGPHLCILITP
jgi:hypothetical protein